MKMISGHLRQKIASKEQLTTTCHIECSDQSGSVCGLHGLPLLKLERNQSSPTNLAHLLLDMITNYF